MTSDPDSPKNNSEQPNAQQGNDPLVEIFKIWEKGGKEALREFLNQ